MPAICVNNRCPCSDNPLANLSSERPDHPIWISNYTFFQEPFIGKDPVPSDCGSTCQETCFSTVSQEEADACAQRLAERCVLCCPPNPSCPPVACTDNQPPPCTDPPVPACPPPYCNVPQGCQDSQYTAGVAAGEFYAHTQADADAIAASVCQHRLKFGPRTPNTPGCPIITGMFPHSPAHVNEGQGVLFQVFYTYPGAGPVQFAWFLNGLPLAFTSVPTFTIDPAMVSDSGTYTVEVSAPGCPTVLSPGVILDVISSTCTDTGVDTTSGGVFGNFVDDFLSLGTQNFPVLVDTIFSVNAPTSGRYQVRYISGAFSYLDFSLTRKYWMGREYEVNLVSVGAGYFSDTRSLESPWQPYTNWFTTQAFWTFPPQLPAAYVAHFIASYNSQIELETTNHNGSFVGYEQFGWEMDLPAGAPITLEYRHVGIGTDELGSINFEIVRTGTYNLNPIANHPDNIRIRDFLTKFSGVLVSNCVAVDPVVTSGNVPWDGTLQIQPASYNFGTLRYTSPFGNFQVLIDDKILTISISLFYNDINSPTPLIGTPCFVLQIGFVYDDSYLPETYVYWTKSHGNTAEGCYTLFTDPGTFCLTVPNKIYFESY